MKWERDNQVIPRADLNLMQISSDFGSDVTIDKALSKLRMLSEDIQLSATSDRTNEGDGSVGSRAYFRIPLHIPLGSRRLDCYAEYLRNGETQRTNTVSTYIIGYEEL